MKVKSKLEKMICDLNSKNLPINMIEDETLPQIKYCCDSRGYECKYFVKFKDEYKNKFKVGKGFCFYNKGDEE